MMAAVKRAHVIKLMNIHVIVHARPKYDSGAKSPYLKKREEETKVFIKVSLMKNVCILYRMIRNGAKS